MDSVVCNQLRPPTTLFSLHWKDILASDSGNRWQWVKHIEERQLKVKLKIYKCISDCFKTYVGTAAIEMRLFIKLREIWIVEMLIIKLKNCYTFIVHFVSNHADIINFIRIFFFFLLPCRRIFVLLFAAFILYYKKATQTSETGNLVPAFSW